MHGSLYWSSEISFFKTKMAAKKIKNKDGLQETKWPLKHKIYHNSVNFQVRSSIFCMVVYIDLPQKKSKPRWRPKKWAPKHRIDHNSVSFQAKSSRFWMVVYIDLPHFFFKKKMAAKKQNGRQNTKLIITLSIFKLWSLYFAW